MRSPAVRFSGEVEARAAPVKRRKPRSEALRIFREFVIGFLGVERAASG